MQPLKVQIIGMRVNHAGNHISISLLKTIGDQERRRRNTSPSEGESAVSRESGKPAEFLNRTRS